MIIVCLRKLCQIISKRIKLITLSKLELSGGAKGADRLGECYAFDNGYSVIRFQALWGVYGKSAGPRRNNEMAKFASESGSGTLIAFWDGESRGTKNMIDTARRYGLHVIVVEYEKDSEELNEQKR